MSYFASDRNLPWWAIAISNTATYQSGSGAFVMLLFMYGLAANWLWWASLDYLDAARRDHLGAALAADANHDHGRAHLAALRRPAGNVRPQSVCRGLLFRLFRVVDRIHHRLLRQNDRSDRRICRSCRFS